MRTANGTEIKVCAAKRAPWAIASESKDLKWAWLVVDPQSHGNDISGLCRTKGEAETKAKATAKRIELIAVGKMKGRKGIEVKTH